MTATLLALAFLFPADDGSTRKPHPLIPSIAELSAEDEEKLDAIIDRFMDADVGKLKGDEALKARAAFDRLGPDAIPALCRAIVRATVLEDSCPTLMIAKKLKAMVARSEDRQLVDYIRDNVPSGLRTRHDGVLADLRTACSLRRTVLVRRGPPTTSPPEEKSLSTLSIADLAKEAGTERGKRLTAVLTELSTRRGAEALNAIAVAATNYDKDVSKLAREMLNKNLMVQSPSLIKDKLTDERLDVRLAAVNAVGAKSLRFGPELIELLKDDNESVRTAAHSALVKFARGTDFGPSTNPTQVDRDDAIKKWREWWDRQP
jgi:HEAT repeat protein